MRIEKLIKGKTTKLIGLGLFCTVLMASIGSVPDFTTKNRTKFFTRSEEKKSLEEDIIFASDSEIAFKPDLEKLQKQAKRNPELTPYFLLKQAQTNISLKEDRSASDTLQKLIEKYPDSPATAEALYLLSKSNPQYLTTGMDRFPHHPSTHKMVRESLQKNPVQPKLMLFRVRYTPNDSGITEICDRLVKNYSNQLKPEDWQTIADFYWKKWEYKKAGEAYARAERNDRNVYRTARGYHLGKEKEIAKKYYLQLFRDYPQGQDTGLGLRRFATIVKRQEAIEYLNIAINNFPEQAPEALIEKAKILEKLNSPTAANTSYQKLITEYPKSEAAAKYLWDKARLYAQKGELVTAWQWAQKLVVNNPQSKLAPKASFWIGKWAKKLGRTEDYKTAFKSTLTSYPRSYYAWRSAVALNLDVGDFNSIRWIQPKVVTAKPFVPPGGSSLFKELYQLGLQEEAWGQFQTEMGNKTDLTVFEDFTYGLMELYRGHNLRGINRIWNLEDRQESEDIEQFQKLQRTNQYWQSLFPIPFSENIFQWSQYRQLNPLLVTSLIRQESRFEPEIRSWAGALGLMQVMPATGANAAKQIGLTSYSLTNPENNINIGTFYLDFTHKKYNHNSMLAVASYNAGPNNVAKWVSRYGLNDFDEFVDRIPFKETKGYVEKVFENYWNYLQIYNPETSKVWDKIS